MKIYYYAHTGHRIGLDRFRRAVAIINSLDGIDITLLTSDYRIAQVAREFGIDKSVGIDVVRNIPNIAHNGDKIIFDSSEANPIMLDDMREYFSTFIRISDNEHDKKDDRELLISPYLNGDGICNAIAVEDKYFESQDKSIEISYFFGDDDYEKDLEKNISFVSDLDPYLQLGFYYFLDYEDMLKDKFPNYFEFEEYEDMIKKSKILITSSPQAVFDSLASGGKPIYVQRLDYTKEFNSIFEKLNIPIVENFDKNHLSEILKTINNRKYEKLSQNSNSIANFIKEALNL
jgi:hypothetical protein